MSAYKTHQEKIRLIREGKLSLVDNIKGSLQKVEELSYLNIFLSVFSEEALTKAEIIEKKISSGSHGKLAGMSFAIKDVLSLAGQKMTCASKFLGNFEPIYTATAVQRLIDEDAIILGKVNCDEFAMGSSNENSAFGAVRNPINPEYVPGGSSGGSAAAVAAGLCDASLGTDTGGSIRQPAAFCGVYGLKPTYSLVSRYGLTAFASSFDTIGPLGNSPEDLALILEVISGHDEKDSTSSHAKFEFSSVFQSSIKKPVIGLPIEYYQSGLNDEILGRINQVKDFLLSEGFQIKEISLPNTQYSIAAYYILTTAEASSNLSRYDGVRYGQRIASNDLIEMYINSRTQGFGKEVKRRIMLGTFVLSSGYYDAYFLKAQKLRRIIKNDFDTAFKEVDIILTPTTPTTAFRLGEKANNPMEMYLSDVYTTSANLAGIPGLNIPAGLDSNGLPIGIQLLSDQFKEDLLIKTALSLKGFTV